jgi:malonyl-CoA/methylmalonyl-CoA synthetase
MANELPLIVRARVHGDGPAIPATERTHTYADLLDASARVAGSLLSIRAAGADDRKTRSGEDLASGGGLDGARVAYLVGPGFAHVAVQWGIWRAGGIGVPLSPHHPAPEIAYFLENARVSAVIADPVHAATLDAAAGARPAPRLATADALGGSAADSIPRSEDDGALLLYTSGTTSRPKGVLLTHANLRAQVESLVAAWEWTSRDRILCFLPLHHVHGLVNVVTCALWSGAQCGFLPAFDAETVWRRIAGGDLTLFMAVPTIYHRLIRAWREAPADRREAGAAGCARMRLMVSGSAALPIRTLEEWREISGHTLLERYGMTEIGMALSNPVRGERRPGFVGTPLPGVEVRLVNEAGAPVGEKDPDAPLGQGEPGEIEVRGPGVFRAYWGHPEATAAAFRDGWFRTGDLAVREAGSYRILGRTSVDIIKTGGYKVSALEIENVLLEHPGVRECAVTAVADPEWGERVVAAVVGDPDGPDPAALRDWARARLAAYKVPREILRVDALPRNAMGKVVKTELRRRFEETGA